MERQVYQLFIEDSTAGFTAGKVESLRDRNIAQTGLRLYDGATVAVAGSLGEPHLPTLEKRAGDMLGSVSFPWKPNRGTVLHREMKGGEQGLVLYEAEALVSSLSREFPDMLISGKLTFGGRTSSLSGDGLDLSFRHRGFKLGLSFKRRDSNAIADGFLDRGGPSWNREQILQELRREFTAFMNPVAPPSAGPLAVVFTEPGVVLSQTATDLNGLRYATGSSLLSGKLGQKVFSSELTLLQYAEEFRGEAFFDAEGTVTPEEGLPLIENGVFRMPFTDIRTAMTYDLPLTGAATAAYDSVPTLGYPEFRVKPSNMTLAELIGGGPAVMVSVTAGGDFTPTGGFGAPVQLAYLLDGSGMPVGRLPECSLSSTVWRMFGDDFLGASRDPFNPSSDQRALVIRMAVEFDQL